MLVGRADVPDPDEKGRTTGNEGPSGHAEAMSFAV